MPLAVDRTEEPAGLDRLPYFAGLVRDLFDEFSRRDAPFTSEQPVFVRSDAELVDRYLGHAPVVDVPRDLLQDAFRLGLDELERLGLWVQTGGEPDPLGDMIGDCLVDALASSLGEYNLRPSPQPRRSLQDDIETRFRDQALSNGTRYLVAKGGDVPVVVINACGLPLKLWHRLISDDHGLKLILVESRAFRLVSGEMHAPDDLKADVEDIVAVLDQEHVATVPVVSWCSGARVGAQLAAEYPYRVRSSVFVAPTFRSHGGALGMGSTFEEQMATIFKAVVQRPNLARYFATAIQELAIPVDWPSLTSDCVARSKRLAGLPAKENVSALLLPMSTSTQLINYAARMTADMAVQDLSTFERIESPILLITGEADEIVNNKTTRAALSMCKNGFIDARITGAGHYITDLQYSYLRSLAVPFLRELVLPKPMARALIDEVIPL